MWLNTEYAEQIWKYLFTAFRFPGFIIGQSTENNNTKKKLGEHVASSKAKNSVVIWYILRKTSKRWAKNTMFYDKVKKFENRVSYFRKG